MNTQPRSGAWKQTAPGAWPGVYTRSAEMTLGYEAARRRVAAFVGGREDEIVFTRGATEAINLVAYSYPRKGRVLLSELEHHSNIVPWQQLCARAGAGAAIVGDAGLLQMFGHCWQWTSSSYSPYPGYQTAPGALGEYNGKFMLNQYVLRGSSCATPAGHARASYRNFFPAGARWQFTGIRLARQA